MITEIKKQITEIEQRDPLTERIIACFYKIHSELGPGFNEKIYHNALKVALTQEDLKYQTEKNSKVLYQNTEVGRFRLDLVVEDKVIVEIKAITGHTPVVFELQVISYLKSSGYKIGLLINFGNKSCQVRRLMI